MKIAQLAASDGAAFWAVLEGDHARALAGDFSHWALEPAAAMEGPWFDACAFKRLAPVDRSARIIGVGLNYLAHLTRLGRQDPPPHPIAYFKPHSAIVHPGDEIQYPAVTAQLDYEVELVAVLARPLGDETRATDCLLGYTIGNDISARDAGKALGRLDLFTQKGLDRTTPIGPHIVTLDELGGGGQPDLQIGLRVNGQIRQEDTTKSMIFTVDELLNYVDARVTLCPGDLVFTGTTCGVGLEDGRFLNPGDVVEAAVQGIGELRNIVGEPRRLAASRRVGRLGLSGMD